MTPPEFDTLVRKIKAIKPAQQWEEDTAEEWGFIIGHLPYDLALTAVRRAAQTETWIGTETILREAGAILREQRQAKQKVIDATPGAVPAADPDDPVAYMRALRAGDFIVPEVGALSLERGPVQHAIAAGTIPLAGSKGFSKQNDGVVDAELVE